MRTELFHRSLTVDEPADRCWSIVADYANDPAWRGGVSSMHPNPAGIVAVGTTTLEVIRFGGRTYRIPGRVETVEHGRAFTWRATKAHGRRSVEPVGPATTRIDVELHLELSGIERLLAPMLIRMMAHRLDADADRLRQLLLATDSSQPPHLVT